ARRSDPPGRVARAAGLLLRGTLPRRAPGGPDLHHAVQPEVLLPAGRQRQAAASLYHCGKPPVQGHATDRPWQRDGGPPEPHLTDAEFFFKQDKKQKLESFNQRLANVVFQAQLGTVLDKAERVSALAGFIAERIGGDPVKARRAGILSKCDLATEMVGEFPE